jgi:hypothetical protein
VLKKMTIVSSAVAVLMVGGFGIASAHDHGHDGTRANCTSNDTTHQSNKGHQALGGSLTAQDFQGNVLGGQVNRAAGVCPSALNSNHL